jgi:hypothetical protein
MHKAITLKAQHHKEQQNKQEVPGKSNERCWARGQKADYNYNQYMFLLVDLFTFSTFFRIVLRMDFVEPRT